MIQLLLVGRLSMIDHSEQTYELEPEGQRNGKIKCLKHHLFCPAVRIKKLKYLGKKFKNGSNISCLICITGMVIAVIIHKE